MLRVVKVLGQIWVMLLASGCSPFDGSFSPVPGVEVVDTAVAPVPDGGLTGRVCSPSGISWVGGAEVRVRDTDRVGRTDADGRYLIEDLPAGDVVLDITKGSFAVSRPWTVEPGLVSTVEPASCLGGDVSIAVVAGLYDRIENLLAALGLPYTLIEVEQTVDWLRDPGSLEPYDVVFFNCGMRGDWRMYPEVRENLRDWVTRGGSIYASDNAHFVIEEPFPDAIDFLGDDDLSALGVQRGVEGDYVARVVDRDLQAVLDDSPTAHIRYDLRNWTIAKDTLGGEPLLSARVLAVAPDPKAPPQPEDSVLAVRARIGKGTVVFTSFHNETQTGVPGSGPTPDMLRILEDIILSL